ncbi:MAG: ribosome biogenesis GTPase YlqF [Zoogloeaceae bacterium]|jgi:ribosome biogenesis GTPase A|nr:ribosome biogenesis GTPase YlqF [Zoogloeaceae bacterium]
MPIQWFPGHMTAARKKAAETLARTDVVLEILDARLPEASCNPMIRQLREFRQRPCLKVLNKADLADPAATKAWLAFYNAQSGVRAVAISCKKTDAAFCPPARIPTLCRQLAPHRNDLVKPLRMMIMGIPNVGKSTLMNALLKKRIAAVGDEPAVTKSQQTLDLGKGMTLTDTPGLMWPKIEHDADGYMLAASHAIGVNAVIETEVALFLGERLLERYAPLLAARYKFDPQGMDGAALLETIAEKRGCRVKGGALDIEKAALLLLADYRSGALGRISLETPETRAAMLETVREPAVEE